MKKIILWSSLCVSVLLVIIDILGTSSLCGGSQNTVCMQNAHAYSQMFFWAIPTLVFSVATFWMQDIVYIKWFRFARIWVPLSMVAIFLAPSYASDWMFPIEKGTVLFVANILFVVISLITIARAWWRGRAV